MTHYERKIFELTNAERRKYGLAALIWSDTLADVARVHSQDLVTSSVLSHTGTDGSTPIQRVHRAGIAISFQGENISAGRNNPEAAIQDWMASAGHRSNILNVEAAYLGVGAIYVVYSRFKYYVTQVFGR